MPTKHAVLFGGRRDPCACQLLSTDDFDAILSVVQRITHVVPSVAIPVSSRQRPPAIFNATDENIRELHSRTRPSTESSRCVHEQSNPSAKIIPAGAFSDLGTGFGLRNEVTFHMGCSRPFGVAPAVREFAPCIRRTLSTDGPATPLGQADAAANYDLQGKHHERPYEPGP